MLPTEEMIRQACLDDSLVKYDSYEEWWDNHSSGVSRLIRKMIVEEFLGYKIDWEYYYEHIGG